MFVRGLLVHPVSTAALVNLEARKPGNLAKVAGRMVQGMETGKVHGSIPDRFARTPVRRSGVVGRND